MHAGRELFPGVVGPLTNEGPNLAQSMPMKPLTQIPLLLFLFLLFPNRISEIITFIKIL